MVKGYGSTDRRDGQPPITPPRNNISATCYKTPARSVESIPRNQSNSAETTYTQESDPLLGEELLLSDVEDVKTNLSNSLQPRSSAFEDDAVQGRNKTHNREGSIADSLIGNNVVVFDDTDTLAYSYEQDDGTIRHFLRDIEERFRGFIGRFLCSNQALPMVCLGLALGIAICVIPALLYVHHPTGTTRIVSGDNAADTQSTAHWSGVPYKKISRAAYGDPVSNFLDESLFHPSLLYEGKSVKSARDTSFARANTVDKTNDDNERMKPFLRSPFPTGAFWTNLVLLPQDSNGKPREISKTQYSYPIVAYPYSYQWSALGKLQVSYSAMRRKIRTNSIQDAFLPDVTIGSVDDIHARHVLKYDSLSVTLRFYGDTKETLEAKNSVDFDHNLWDTYIVQGSPYITARYYGLRPEITALSDFNDIICPPTMKREETGEYTESNSTHQHRRKLSVFAQPSSTLETGTSSKKLGVCGISESSSQNKKVVTGVQFVVTSQEGLIWLVFASEPITFEFDLAARRSIKSLTPFQGVIRLALVPPPQTDIQSMASNMTDLVSLNVEKLASSSGVKRLIYHAGTFPIGGNVHWNFQSASRGPLASKSTSGRRRLRDLSSTDKESNIGSVTFTFNTMHMSALESTSTSAPMELLMLSLPHHAASISSAGKVLFNPQDFDLFFRCIKGRMLPVIGVSWTYDEKLTSIGFGEQTSIDDISNPRLSASALDQSIRDLILQTVDSDLNINLPNLRNGAYSFGKGIARLAQLALIAGSIEEVNRQKHVSNKNVASEENGSRGSKPTTSERAYALLEEYLTMWFDGEWLFFDVDLGGIVSKNGLSDVFSDFGNVRYNGKKECC